jgi:hypothetical protein
MTRLHFEPLNDNLKFDTLKKAIANFYRDENGKDSSFHHILYRGLVNNLILMIALKDDQVRLNNLNKLHSWFQSRMLVGQLDKKTVTSKSNAHFVKPSESSIFTDVKSMS